MMNMNPEAEYLDEILDRERTAARRVDIQALVEIQTEKREAIAALREVETSEAVTEGLSKKARSNIKLMKHLVQCLQGLAGVDQGTYSASGLQLDTDPMSLIQGAA